MDRVNKEAKEVGLKEEEKETVLSRASVEEAKTKRVAAVKTIPKEKEGAVGTTKERIIVGNRPGLVNQLPIVKRRRRVHTERSVSTCATTVIALNGMNVGKSRKPRRSAETRKRSK